MTTKKIILNELRNLVKQIIKEEIEKEYHYVIHTKLSTRLNDMGDLYWVKAPSSILGSQVLSKFKERNTNLPKLYITQISKDSFDKNAKNVVAIK
jgi:hypothetical protein